MPSPAGWLGASLCWLVIAQMRCPWYRWCHLVVRQLTGLRAGALQVVRSTGAVWLDEVRDNATIDSCSFSGRTRTACPAAQG